MKLRNILFWILILAAVGVTVWLNIGFPTIKTGLLMIVIFIATSEILLWKFLFKMDKRTIVGFVKIKSDINNLKNTFNNKFDEMNNRLKNIENLIKSKKRR